jgi:hypothetical protein
MLSTEASHLQAAICKQNQNKYRKQMTRHH